MKKDDIQLQMGGGVMDRGDSNHSDAKYDTSLDTSHDNGGMLRGGGHEMMVRTTHDHDQVKKNNLLFIWFYMAALDAIIT